MIEALKASLGITKEQATLNRLHERGAEVRICCEYCARDVKEGKHDILFDVETIIIETHPSFTQDEEEEPFCGFCKLPLYSDRPAHKAVFVWAEEEDED